MAKADPRPGPSSIRSDGLRPSLTPGGLEMLIGAITAQQVNLAFAFALRARLVALRSSRRHRRRDGLRLPDARLARGRIAELRAMQFSTRKAEYIRDLARAVAAGADLDVPGGTPSAVIIDLLTAQRGLGRWTADWFLARCLGRGDVCPAGDLAVRKAFVQHYGRGRTLSERAIRRRASAWGAHQTVAVHYLLAGLRLAGPRAGGGT
jgi:DNA-3-methyladenine glycosylase II